jgi:tetratricopeptide (TPR) repeat protein
MACTLPVWAGDGGTAAADSAYRMGKKFDYFFLEMVRAKENGEHSNVFNALRHALSIDSTSAAVWYELSIYYHYLQMDSQAVAAMRKAVQYSPNNFTYRASLANLYREQENIQEAIALYEQLAEESPDKAELHLHLSNLYLRNRQPDKAIGSLNSLENNTGISEAVSMQKYNLYLSTGEKDKALKELERLRAKFPSEVKYPVFIGDFYMEEPETGKEKALAYYEKARAIDPENPFYIIAMANYYEQTGNIEAAAGEIGKAFKNSSLDREMQMVILEKFIQTLFFNKQDMGTVNLLFDTLLAQQAEETELNLMYGQFLASQNKWYEAGIRFQTVAAAHPDNMDTWLQLLNAVLHQDSADKIVPVCDSALTHFPEVPEFYYYKSAALYQQKQFATALMSAEEGVKHVPEENISLLSGFYGQLGDLYHETGQKQKSYEAYDKALKYDENNISVMNNYAYFLSLDKMQLDKAESMSGKCLKSQPKNPTFVDTYAWILFQKGNYSLSKFYIESAIANGGDESPEVLDHYGDILFKTGNTGNAVTQWEKALEMKEQRGEADTAILKRKIADRTYYETEK